LGEEWTVSEECVRTGRLIETSDPTTREKKWQENGKHCRMLKYYFDINIKEDVMGKACSTHG
jgi:hypothetical protein